MNSIGDSLRTFRKQASMTQQQLSVLSCVPQSTISDIEKNQREASAMSLYKISKALNVHICSFFGETSDHLAAASNGLLDGLTNKQADLIRQLVMQIRNATNENMKCLSGYAAAGMPVYSPGDDGVMIPVPEKYLDSRFFVVSAKGNSMEPRIKNGDYVIVQKDTPGDEGDIVLVRIDSAAEGEYMIKRYYRHGSSLEFRSINKAFKPVLYPADKVLSIEKIVMIINK